MLLASLLGGLILLFGIFILIASLASIKSPEMEVADQSVLRINLNGQIVERAQSNPFGSFSPFGDFMDGATGLDKILASLNAAQDDPKILGVYLSGGIPLAGNASLKELRDALLDFKESGKFIYGYSEVLTQKGLYIASVADSFFVNPEGFVEFNGLSATVTYYREALEKLGVKPVVLRATGNKFKSAVEPFLEQEMSAENRLQLEELLQDNWGEYLSAMAESTGLSEAQLNLLADSLITKPKMAMEKGLLQGLAYEDEVQDLLTEATEASKFDKVNFISPAKYAKKKDYRGDEEYLDQRVAVVIAQGEIQSGSGDEYTIGSERIAGAIRKARLNDNVKAIVLRINSPGGSALASEIIWREVDLARQAKPVIASMGDVAASGGYYIAAFADTILAQANTVTGSIGAFGLFFTAEELMHEKLGINLETVKTNHYGDLAVPDRDLRPDEMRRLIAQVDQIYGTFKKRVAEGRGMSLERVEELGQGRVYSGARAQELGLVDLLGGIDDAIRIAAEKAGISENYSVVNYPKLKDPFEAFLANFSDNFGAKALEQQLGSYARYFRIIEKAQGMEGFQTRLEYELEIN